MVLPALAFVTGVAVPAGWLSESDLAALIRDPLTRVVLVGLVFLFLFHWAHRFRYALVDLGFGRIGKQAWLFYGAATAGTVLAALAAIGL
jgi:fumarate reductase subunit D